MALDDRKIWAEPRRDAPANNAQTGSVALQCDVNQALFVRKTDSYSRADGGQYFVLRNATPGTGIAGHAAATTLDDTKPFVYLRCDYTTAERKRIYLDYIRTEVTAAGTGGTNLRYGMKLDSGTARYTSGGSALTAVNPNMQSTTTLSATANIGAVVAAAASTSVRIVSSGLIRSVINVIGDKYLFRFGAVDAMSGAGMATEGTAQAQIVHYCPPVILGPTDQFLFHFFSASQSAASSHEWEMGLYVV